MDRSFVIDFQRKIEEWLNSYMFSRLPTNPVRLQVAIRECELFRGMHRCEVTDITSEEMQARVRECPDLLHSVDQLNFSTRVCNCLDYAGIRTIGQLAQFSAQDLLGIRNFGPTCLDEVRQKLAEIGLSLAGEG